MKRFWSPLSVLALVIGIFLVCGAFCQECTPATCPDIPVMIYFQYANCTGDRRYFHAVPADVGECSVSGDNYQITTVRPDGVATYFALNIPGCDYTRANATYELAVSKFGVCNQGGLSKRDAKDDSLSLLHAGLLERDAQALLSSILLRNANETFTAPQNFDSSNPTNLTNLYEIATVAVPCFSVGNCTASNGAPAPVYFTAFSEPGNCSSFTESTTFPDLQLNQCYYYPGYGYCKITCAGDANTYNIDIYNDPECMTQFGVQSIRIPCSATNSPQSVTCRVATEPTTPAPTPSAASPLGFTSLMAAVLAILALIAA